MSALENSDPKNPIAAEVTRFIAGFTANFARHVKQLRYVLSGIHGVRLSKP
jgi:hypothetical protein